MWNSELLRRVEVLERHANTCNDRDNRKMVSEATMESTLAKICETLDSNMEREREIHNNTNRVLKEISDSLVNIKQEMALQPAVIKESMHETHEKVLEEIEGRFAAKTDLQMVVLNIEGFKQQLRLIWMTIVVVAAVAGWVYVNVPMSTHVDVHTQSYKD
jgi:hypothetical protein